VNFTFFINCVLLGIGLTMDAFSVSLANGFNEPKMKSKKIIGIALTFAIFQGIMPLIGWFLVHNFIERFKQFEPFIPVIALVLLAFIGGKMIFEHFKKDPEEEKIEEKLGFFALMLQGLATSIDALSVGFTIAEYDFLMAVIAVVIISSITFCFCFAGVILGKKFGVKLGKKAELIGGIILVLIGIEIFISSLI